METLTCKNCGPKPKEQFPKNRPTQCKVCKNKYERERRSKDREHHNKGNRKSYHKVKEMKKGLVIKVDKDKKKTCTGCGNEKTESDFYLHAQKGVIRPHCKDCCSKQRKTRYRANRDAIIKQTSKYKTERMKVDPAFKLEVRMRNRIYHAFKTQNKVKKERTLQFLGCTKEFFRNWIQHQLKEGMTLDNYGEVWHVDHVKPCALSFLCKSCFNSSISFSLDLSRLCKSLSDIFSLI